MREAHGQKDFYRLVGWSLTAAVLLVVTGFLLYGSAGRDDAHITYWPAYTLAHMGQILNYNGQAVEQSSSLLHVVVLAMGHVSSGVDIVTLGRLSSIFFGVASLPLTYVLARRLHPRAGPLATLATALCGSFVYWAFGGLETTLASFCVLWTLIAFDDVLRAESVSYPEWAHAAVSILSMITVRPEMPIVLGCLLIGTGALLFWRGAWLRTRNSLALLGGLSAVLIFVLFAGRYLATGRFFPLPVAAKSPGVSVDRALQGLEYIHNFIRTPEGIRFGLTPIGIFGSTAAVAALLDLFRRLYGSRPNDIVAFLGGSFGVAYLSFIVLSGGDWMEAGRFIVPLVPVASAFIAAEACLLFSDRLYPVVALLIVLISVSTNLNIVLHQSTGMPITARDEYLKKLKSHGVDTERFSWFETRNRVHSRDFVALEKIEKVLRLSGDSRVSIISGKMGFTMYHLYKEEEYSLQSIDNYGLTDNKVRGCISKIDSVSTENKISVEIKEILSKIDKFENQCSIEKPEVLYKLGIENIPYFREKGYELVYVQEGEMSLSNEFIGGGKVHSDQTLMIREEMRENVKLGVNFKTYLRTP